MSNSGTLQKEKILQGLASYFVGNFVSCTVKTEVHDVLRGS